MTQAPNQTRPPSLLLLMLEARALFELGSYLPSLPFLRALPKGDGHPVIVFPGLLATDISTKPLRHFLKERGYGAAKWGMGRNLGYNPALDQNMQDRVVSISKQYGAKVSLVGWSLGGVYARELSRQLPEHVRQVITMGSPLSGSTKANNAHWLYDQVSGMKLSEVDPQLLERMAQPPPVPTTAIFSKTDGVVSWRCCREQEEGPEIENVEVPGSHFGLGFNPLALLVVADRLAQAEGDWSPFQRSGYRRFFYPDRQRKRAKKSKKAWGSRIDDLEISLKKLTRRHPTGQ